MKSIIQSFFTIIFLLFVILGLYFLANPTAYHIASDRINTYVRSAKENKTFSWLGGNSHNNQEETTSTIPILMYHHIKNHKEGDDETEKGLSVEVSNFNQQMQYLGDNGYDTIQLDDLFAKNKTDSVVLTFDDAYKDVYTNAYPIMKKYNLTGTVFVITDFVGGDRYMTWDELRELKEAGWQIESHTLSHPNLANISTEDAWDQISESKKIIEESVGSIVTFISYPAGQYDDEVIDLTQKAGYTGAVSTEQGIVNEIQDIYHLKRERVGGYSELGDFIGLLK